MATVPMMTVECHDSFASDWFEPVAVELTIVEVAEHDHRRRAHVLVVVVPFCHGVVVDLKGGPAESVRGVLCRPVLQYSVQPTSQLGEPAVTLLRDDPV